jgi:hypothetical protein
MGVAYISPITVYKDSKGEFYVNPLCTGLGIERAVN